MSNNKSLLLVAEKKQLRDQISQALRKAYNVKVATGGFHAVHLIEQETFELIVVIGDSQDMAATELITLLRTNFSQRELPILFLGGKGGTDMLDAIEVGANAYLPLTQNLNILLKKIQELSA